MRLKPTDKLLSALAAVLACVMLGCSATAAMANAATGGTEATATISPKSNKPQIATWFGPGFYGQKTACGQTMTPVVVGVASRTLSCGTLVLINYRGHKLTVPVIDRGPYAKNGATWDLTAGAATALTITETVRVKTKVVGKTANTPGLGAPPEARPSPEAATAGAISAPLP